MTTLERTQRQLLEKVIKEARAVAEAAAKAALTELGVGEAQAPVHLTKEMRDLRRRLRIHGRQLGDERNALAKTQELSRLVEEIAYEHWHRMLFARFLAENDLLMYPDPNHPVPITLEECEDLAADRGRANGWVVAAEFAAQMLPQIFRLSSPVFEMILPKNRLRELEQLLSSLPAETFIASDSLGWVYQFWQAQRKDEVNASEVKIGARELPAVTQLFTEDYMVEFLLDNSLGAWWAGKQLGITDEETGIAGESEEELRRRASIPGLPLKYLRFAQLENKNWIPAAGVFPDWPDTLDKFKSLDPCCGSGHFLVALMHMLVPIRIQMERLNASEAIDLVLENNLYGLEIDPRCVEIAVFAVAISAWTYQGAIGYRRLPRMHIACSGLPIAATKTEWRSIAQDNRQLAQFLDYLYMIFKDAPIFGSLANPTWAAQEGELFEPEWNVITAGLDALIELEQRDIFYGVESRLELAVAAGGLGKAAQILSQRYNLVTTNVPYLSSQKQSERLKKFCEKYYPEAKRDLATVFVQRSRLLLRDGGTLSAVLPQNWLFQQKYEDFRADILKHCEWIFLSILGEGAFESSQAAGAFVCNLILTEKKHKDKDIRVIDTVSSKGIESKRKALETGNIDTVSQKSQLENPGYIFTLQSTEGLSSFGNMVDCYQGTSTGDNVRFTRQFWEVVRLASNWEFFLTPPHECNLYAGRHSIVSTLVFDENEGMGAIRGRHAWGNLGVAIGKMRALPATLYLGERFSNTTPVIIPKRKDNLHTIWTFSSNPAFNTSMRQINPNVAIENGYVAKLFWDEIRWKNKSSEEYLTGLPLPFSNDCIQWVVHGHPCGSVVWDNAQKRTVVGQLRRDDTVFQVAVARLLGYQWPAELDPTMELADEQREWVDKAKTLNEFADEDGIVCIPSVRGEVGAADRLLKLLVASYGKSWSNQVLSDLLKAAGAQGKTLEVYLREYFFTQHCKLFQHRPFIWQIWDGLSDGFSVLVNYHKLDHKLLETLIYDYLGDWISRQQRDKDHLVDGSEEKLAAAKVLKQRLELILEGEKPYDIFVRWKPLEEQPIGWDPDLNDGVRLNIRPFMSVPDIRKKGAGVLRDKPNIHWRKDRGKDVSTAPWYHLGPEYGGKEGDRINDHHLSLAEKQSARAKVGE